MAAKNTYYNARLLQREYSRVRRQSENMHIEAMLQNPNKRSLFYKKNMVDLKMSFLLAHDEAAWIRSLDKKGNPGINIVMSSSDFSRSISIF